jgi:hypothetical protein
MSAQFLFRRALLALALLTSLCGASAAHATDCKVKGKVTIALFPCPLTETFKYGTASPVDIHVSIAGTLPNPFYVLLTPSVNVVQPNTFRLEGNPDSFQILFSTYTKIPSGNHSVALDIKLCGDSKCKTVLADVGLPSTFDSVVPPNLTQLSPASEALGAKTFTLKLMGGGFTSGSKVHFGSLVLTPKFVSALELTATVNLSTVAKGQVYNVSVVPSTGIASQVQHFTLKNPLPVITKLTPASGLVQQAPFTMTVTGKGFVNGSKIKLGSTALTTKYVSATKLTATVDLSTTTATAVDTITVVSPTPGGGTSVAANLEVDNPVPVITNVSPNRLEPTAGQHLFTVTGTGFQSNSVISWNGVPQATGHVSATELTGLSPGTTALATRGEATLSVSTPAPGGGTASTVIGIGSPQVRWISPNFVPAGSGDVTLTLGGTDFTAATMVEWGNTPLTVTAQTSTILQATLPAADVAAAGEFTVSAVETGIAGPGDSAPFEVAVVTPQIMSLSPGFTTPGNAKFTLTVFGTAFAPAAKVLWNGTALVTTFVSANELHAAVPAADVAAQGSAVILVSNDGTVNGESNEAAFAVASGGTLVLPLAQTVNDVEWDPYFAVFFGSVPAGPVTDPHSMVQIDPFTASVVSTHDMSGTEAVAAFSPELISRSPDESFLYVSGSGYALRLDRASFTPENGGTSFNGGVVLAVQASPTSVHVGAWIGVNAGVRQRIIDADGGAGSTDTAHTWSALAWSPDGNTLYSADGTSGADFSSLSYGITTGAQNEIVTPGLWSGTRMQVDTASGLIYGDNSANVIDPAGPSVVGTLPVSGIMVPDSIFGCAYFITQTSAQVTAGANDYTLSCYSTADFTTLTRSVVIPAVHGTPIRMKRWGNEGLVFITDGGYIYFVSGQVVTGN